MTARIVVLASGAGSNLQALLSACRDPAYGAEVAAVGADRYECGALERAKDAGVSTFVVSLNELGSRDEWDRALAEQVAGYDPDLVVSAGFMKIVGAPLLDRFANRYINTHPALLPAFPGAHAVRDALAYGVKVTGVTVHIVDSGVDTGPVIAQQAVPVLRGDDEARLHERIKAAERPLLVETVGRMAREGYQVRDREVVIG